MTVNKKQGQAPAETKYRGNLYRLILTKEELKAIRIALQIDYETLSELLKDDPEWKHIQNVVEKAFSKVRELETESE